MTHGTRILLTCALLAPAILSGCDLWGGDDPGEGESATLAPPADSAATDPAALGETGAATDPAALLDSATALDSTAAVGPAGEEAPGPDRDTEPGARSEGTDVSSEAGPQDEVAARLDRLEAENDSLRAAVGVLLGQLSGSPDQGEAAPAEADTANADLIAAGGQQVRHWGIRIFVSLIFLALVGLLVRGTVWLLDRLSERNAASRLFFKRVVPIARIVLWTLALLFVAMVILEVDAQGLVAAGAAVGVAVGFAAQDILKNVFGGLIVLFDQPFQVGDKIRVGGTYGEVVSIGLRSTRITTPDDNLVSVPNSQVVGDQVSNANAGALNCQVVTDLFLPNDVDEVLAKRIAFEAAAGSRYLFRKKPIVVLVKSMYEHTFFTRIRVKAYVLDPRLEFAFESDVTERARAGFREAGISLLDRSDPDRSQAPVESTGAWSPDEVAP